MWCTLAFAFEPCNGKLLQFFRGTQYVSLQIWKCVLEISQLTECDVNYLENGDIAINYFSSLIDGPKAHILKNMDQ